MCIAITPCKLTLPDYLANGKAFDVTLLSYNVGSEGLSYSVRSDRLCSKCEEVSELTMLA